MSTIAAKLKESREAFFVVELNKNGRKRYFSTADFNIPYSAGDDIHVEGIVNSHFSFGPSFDLRNFSCSTQSIKIGLQNHLRHQNDDDFFEGADASIFVFCDGLDWSDIMQNGKLMSGYSVRAGYNRSVYAIQVEDTIKNLGNFNAPILSDGDLATFGSVDDDNEGKYYPIVFGDSAVAPMPYVNNKVIMLWGYSSATTAEFDASTLVFYLENGSAYGWSVAGDSIKKEHDLLGNAVTYGDSIGATALFGDVHGYHDDANGYYTGEASKVLTHPGHITHYMFDHFATPNIDIDLPSINGLANLLPSLKFETVILSNASVRDILNRFGYQYLAAIYQRRGKVGLFWMDYNGAPVGSINTELDARGGHVTIGKTKDDSVVNNILAKGAYNRIFSRYDYTAVFNSTNNDTCKQSVNQYGERPVFTFECFDTEDGDTTDICARRRLQMWGFRHDLISFKMEIADAWDLQEGMVYEITCPDGPGAGGWVNEKFILLPVKWSSNGLVSTSWWRVNV